MIPDRTPSQARHERHDNDTVETIAARCPFCFSRSSSAIDELSAVDGPVWRVVGCDDCGQRFTNPRPRSEDWRRFYREDYKPHQLKIKTERWHSRLRRRLDRWLLDWYRGYSATDHSHSRRRWATLLSPLVGGMLDPYIPPRHGEGMLLDVGCGPGRYLARMRELGWDVLGLDRSRWAAETARTHFGVPVVVDTLPSEELPAGEFDLVTAWEVLEHLDRPRQALAGIRELLRPTGRLMLTVPNQDGWAAKTFGSAWVGLDLPRHLTHFSPKTLARMLQAEHFEIVHLATLGQSGWIRHSARAFPFGSKLRLFGSKLISRIASGLAVKRDAGESIYVIATPK